jgi:hypothetical protein
VNEAQASRDGEPNRFRMTLDELEKSAHVPPDKLVTAAADDREIAQTDAERQVRDTLWAGG